mmetsp:Transcript_13326/g.24403  ORF Transcript_13326/g.24403 Transcript_13326/m.24403 type:complete len:273 (+) Transcript_13326:926-1744(+)
MHILAREPQRGRLQAPGGLPVLPLRLVQAQNQFLDLGPEVVEPTGRDEVDVVGLLLRHVVGHRLVVHTGGILHTDLHLCAADGEELLCPFVVKLQLAVGVVDAPQLELPFVAAHVGGQDRDPFLRHVQVQPVLAPEGLELHAVLLPLHGPRHGLEVRDGQGLGAEQRGGVVAGQGLDAEVPRLHADGDGLAVVLAGEREALGVVLRVAVHVREGLVVFEVVDAVCQVFGQQRCDGLEVAKLNDAPELRVGQARDPRRIVRQQRIAPNRLDVR